jgi:hypothetical protein
MGSPNAKDKFVKRVRFTGDDSSTVHTQGDSVKFLEMWSICGWHREVESGKASQAG